MHDRYTPLLALLVVLATVPLGGAVAQSSPDLRTVDGATTLTTADGVDAFQSSGQVNASVESIQLDVRVTETATAANASGVHLDPLNTYLRVDYDESVPRTVRIHVDGEIIAPRPNQGHTPIGDSEATADLQVAEDGTVQSIVLHLPGETHATWKTNDAKGMVTGIKRTTTGYVDQFARNVTGIGLPTFGGGEWGYVPQGSLSGTNVSYAIPNSQNHSTMTLQYQATNESWYSVPECSSDTPVCTVQRSNQTVVVSTTSDAPSVRYKFGTDLLAGLQSAVDDATNIPSNAWDWVAGLVGGG